MDSKQILNFLLAKGVSKDEIGAAIFKKHKHPVNALNRILRGEGALSAENLATLDSVFGIPMELAESGGGWALDTECSTAKFLSFVSEDGHRAVLNSATNICTVEKVSSSSLVPQHVGNLIISNDTTLTSFIKVLNDIIRPKTNL